VSRPASLSCQSMKRSAFGMGPDGFWIDWGRFSTE
jgi:hypothetical protein